MVRTLKKMKPRMQPLLQLQSTSADFFFLAGNVETVSAVPVSISQNLLYTMYIDGSLCCRHTLCTQLYTCTAVSLFSSWILSLQLFSQPWLLDWTSLPGVIGPVRWPLTPWPHLPPLQKIGPCRVLCGECSEWSRRKSGGFIWEGQGDSAGTRQFL